MDFFLSFTIFVASIFCFLLFSHLGLGWLRNRGNTSKKLGEMVPEAPGSWPIIGHLHLLAGSLPHKLFGSMADKFGPIFCIKLGVHRVLVVSNSEIAKEVLTTNDRVFAGRPKSMATEVMGYNFANFGFAPYGPYWRQIRKILVLELGSHHRLQILAEIRVAEVKSSMMDIHTSWIRNKGSSEMVMVDMKEWFGNLIVNMVARMLFGDRFSTSEENQEFKKTIRPYIELLGAYVPSDAIPGLRWLDIGGYEKKMKKSIKELDIVMSRWLEDHEKKMNSATQQVDERKDRALMAALLSRVGELKEEHYGFSTETMMKATCLAILGAGTDTTTVTLTWALSLLANHPLVLSKAQEELEIHVGRERNVEESDIKNLVYLEAIIKETMRLYPPGPLLLPHESTEDCIVSGYTIPKGTQLFLNAWKIQRDPKIWSDPFEFQPERFLKSYKDIDVKGQHYELIPFGSGRRVCPGIPFALDAVKLILASIIHGFEFQNPLNEQIDMTESPKLTNLKPTPLELLVAPRLSPDLYRM